MRHAAVHQQTTRLTNETPEGERITGRIQKLQWQASLRDKGNFTVAEALLPKISATPVRLKTIAKPWE
jgi:hypothetical protein